jgi:hypothetical protein
MNHAIYLFFQEKKGNPQGFSRKKGNPQGSRPKRVLNQSLFFFRNGTNLYNTKYSGNLLIPEETKPSTSIKSVRLNLQ